MMKLVTKAVQKEVPADLINIIWEFYDEGYLGNLVLDDYQFVTLTANESSSMMKIWQKVPPAMKTKTIPRYKNYEIWIIDHVDGVTMLFPREY